MRTVEAFGGLPFAIPLRREIGPQELDGVAEGDALGAHHPVDHGASRLAGAEAVPEILARRDHETRLAVVVEGAEPEEVGAVALEPDPARLGQALERDLALQSLDLRCRDARHRNPPLAENLSRGESRQRPVRRGRREASTGIYSLGES